MGSQATPGSRSRELLGGIEHIAPATQKERVVTKYFSEDGLLVHLPHKMEIGSRETSPRHRKYCNLPHKKKVGSSLSPMICTCHTKRRWNHKKCSEASKNIAPATQKESRVTIVANDLHLPHKQNVYTRNFSEPSRILHLPHKKQVGSPVSPNLGSQSTSRRH